MARKTLILLAAMTIFVIPAFGDGRITVNVSVDGTPQGGAYVGVRTAPNALADCEVARGQTSGGGVYTTSTLADGTYYVAAFVDGYVADEDSVTISGANVVVNLNITEVVTQNLVQTKLVPSTPGRYFSGSDCGDGSPPDYVNTSPAGGNTFVNGVRPDATTNSGCWGAPSKVHIGVDLGANHQVSQAMVCWYNDGNWWPAYEIQYAVDNGTGIPGLNSLQWQTWGVGRSVNMNRPFNFSAGGGWASVITGTPTSARYWRIYTPSHPALAIREFELHSTVELPPPPGTISGTVTVSGSMPADRTVGIKTSPSATADADQYCGVTATGQYLSSVLAPGTYYVGVWLDGYRMQETTVVVSSTAPSTCNFNVTDPQNANLSSGKPGFGGVWGTDNVFYPVTGGQPNGGSPTFLDGTRGNGYTIAGDFRVVSGTGGTPMAMGVDLGEDKQVDQMLIDWYFDGAWYWPRNGYRVQYALDGSDPALGSPHWQDWYIYSGPNQPKPWGASVTNYEMISGMPTAARYWRIFANDGYGWNAATFLVQEWELYSAAAGGKISGTVSVNGTPVQGAVVGLKSSPSPLADADEYFVTDVNGNYETGVLDPNSTHYVGAWVDGYHVEEETVVISGNVDQDFNLTEARDVNLAQNKLGFGGVIGPDGTDYGTAGGVPNYGGNNTFNNGTRDDYYTIAGDLRRPSGQGTPIQLGVDLGSDKQVDQMLLDWYGSQYDPRGGYKIQYAVDSPGGLPAIGSTAWQNWYQYVGAFPQPGIGNDYEIITGPPTAARWWRIYADDGWSDGWGLAAFLVQEWEVYSAYPGSRISGTVTDGSSNPIPGAVVGIKSTSNALADADAYCETNGSGYYESGKLEGGITYYVGAWADGYRAEETAVQLNSDEVQDFQLDQPQYPGAALGMPTFGEGIWFDGSTHNIGVSDEVTVAGAIVDGVRDGTYNWVGNVSESATHPYPMAMGVDCLLNREVSQIMIDWYDDAATYWPTNGYKVQYAVDNSGGVPAFNSPAWVTWYERVGPTIPFNVGTPDVPEAYVFITGPTVYARYWRIRCEDSVSSWAGRPAFLVQEFSIFSPTLATLSIPRIKGLPDGAGVTVAGRTVTVAPRDGGGYRLQTFYVEEADRLAGIRVENTTWFGDNLRPNQTTTISGVLGTTLFGERCIVIPNDGNEPIGTPGLTIDPLGVITRSIHEDPKLVGQLVRVAGMVKQVAGDGTYFTITDGYSNAEGLVETTVLVSDPAMISGLLAGTVRTVTGAVGKDGTSAEDAHSVIILREIN